MTKTKTIKTLLFLLALPFLIIGSKKIIDLRKKAAGTHANILIDTQKVINPLPASLWQNLAQGGEEAKDMVAPVLAQTKVLQPKYIRIDHLFDYYQVYRGPEDFDFSQLDQVIETILATGAKPMLSLSYTPAMMTKNGQNATEPQDWNQWYQLVKTTAHRYSVQKNISNIYYEVWNEPDLFGSWHYRKNPNYLTLYTQSARAVTAGATGSNYKIGGPSTTALYKSWIVALLDICQKQNLRLDFLSFHRYSTKISQFQKDAQLLDQILVDYPRYKNVEKIITETGPYSDPHSSYDNKFSAIHLLSLTSSLSNQINKLFTFELVDGPIPRSTDSTGWGLITHAKNGSRPKPRYQAMQFLNRLTGPQILTSGNGTWVSSIATKNQKITQVMLVNYDPKDQHYETVPVNFQHLTPGAYRLETSRFLGPTISKELRILYTHHTEFITLTPNSAVFLRLIPLSLSSP